MSKRKCTQTSISNYLSSNSKSKQKKGESEQNDENEEDNYSEYNFSSTGNTQSQPSKHNQFLFDLTMEQVKHEQNGIDWTLLFDFDFHFLGTSSGQVNVARGDGEISAASPSTSKVNVHIGGLAMYNENAGVKLQLDFGADDKGKRNW